MAENETEKPLFRDINADDEEQEVTEIESLCLNCYKQGMTRLLLTKIPFFKEVIISSFSCDDCGHSDTSIQSGGRTTEKGVKYSLVASTQTDLNRQVIKSEYATFKIPELEFEQPPSKKGEITTVEGLIDNTVTGLEMFQPQRRESEPEVAAKLDEFIARLKALKDLKKPFAVELDDPSGNSFLENPNAPQKDEDLTTIHYVRTHEQDVQIGIANEDEDEAENETEEAEPDMEAARNMKNEVLMFKDNCPSCNSPCDTNMKIVEIPFFKEVIIMATNCDRCGHRDNEVKGGSGFEEKGKLIKLHITDKSDLNRDVLKSDTCAVRIPELELDMEEGTLGGRFTTIEGILLKIKEQLTGSNPLMSGDSSGSETRAQLHAFCEKLDKVRTGETLDVHFILDDPAGNSYLQNVYAPDPDPEMTTEEYVRNYEQNEILGLNDMKVENYSTTDNS